MDVFCKINSASIDENFQESSYVAVHILWFLSYLISCYFWPHSLPLAHSLPHTMLREKSSSDRLADFNYDKAKTRHFNFSFGKFIQQERY